jgi:hypothetical protein
MELILLVHGIISRQGRKDQIGSKRLVVVSILLHPVDGFNIVGHVFIDQEFDAKLIKGYVISWKVSLLILIIQTDLSHGHGRKIYGRAEVFNVSEIGILNSKLEGYLLQKIQIGRQSTHGLQIFMGKKKGLSFRRAPLIQLVKDYWAP